MIEISDGYYNYLNNLLYNTPRIVKEHIMLNNVDFKVRDDFFKLKEFIDKILREDSDDRYFLMSGLRGVGKTTLLFQLYNYLHFEKKYPVRDYYTWIWEELKIFLILIFKNF